MRQSSLIINFSLLVQCGFILPQTVVEINLCVTYSLRPSYDQKMCQKLCGRSAIFLGSTGKSVISTPRKPIRGHTPACKRGINFVEIKCHCNNDRVVDGDYSEINWDHVHM